MTGTAGGADGERKGGGHSTDQGPTEAPANNPGGQVDAGPLRVDAIVVAAGESRRMQGIDKVRVSLAGRPLLQWTLEAIAAAPEVERIVVVAGPGAVETVAAESWLPPKVVSVVAGGMRRQESVAAGVEALDGGRDRILLIHDAARPLATSALATRVAHATSEHGAVIPVVAVSETLKQIAGDLVTATVDRAPLAAAQTPQGFQRGLLEAAYAERPAGAPETWTDEAALLEACRIAVHAIPGEPMNLKITLPDDLVRAEAVLTARSAAGVAAEERSRPSLAAGGLRVGIGLDSHPFGPGAPLSLGGLTIPGAPRLHGHSDGDVVLHAVADALLGAAGLGDLGRHFPSGPETERGISSRKLLAAVVERVRSAGFEPAAVDLTIVGSRPKLVPYLDRIRVAIAELLDLDRAAVSVKASTGNLGGREGGGRGISAEALVSVASGTSPSVQTPARP